MSNTQGKSASYANMMVRKVNSSILQTRNARIAPQLYFCRSLDSVCLSTWVPMYSLIHRLIALLSRVDCASDHHPFAYFISRKETARRVAIRSIK